MRLVIKSETGSRAVVISANDSTGPFTGNLYVNCCVQNNHIELGDITLMRKQARKLSTVETWARKAVQS